MEKTKALECIARFLTTVQQGPKVWHKLFGNVEFRRDLGFDKLLATQLESFEATDCFKGKVKTLIDTYFDDLGFREIVAAFLVKLAGMSGVL